MNSNANISKEKIQVDKNDNPVLNNPYEEPKFYYDTDMNGNIDYQTIVKGRRPFGYDVNIVPNKTTTRTLFSQEDFRRNGQKVGCF